MFFIRGNAVKVWYSKFQAQVPASLFPSVWSYKQYHLGVASNIELQREMGRDKGRVALTLLSELSVDGWDKPPKTALRIQGACVPLARAPAIRFITLRSELWCWVCAHPQLKLTSKLHITTDHTVVVNWWNACILNINLPEVNEQSHHVYLTALWWCGATL